MNIFKSGIDDDLIYDVIYKRNHQLVLKRIQKSEKKIIEYLQSKDINRLSIDDIIDLSMCKYIINFVNDNEELFEIKQYISEEIINKYSTKQIVEFIEQNYLNLRELTTDTREQLIVIDVILLEIVNKNIKNINIEKLFKKYVIDFFNRVDLFYKSNKNTIFKLLSQKDVNSELVRYKVIDLFSFIRKHSSEIKSSRYYNKIIDITIENINLQKDIYKKSNNYLQLIYLLEDLKYGKVKDIKKDYKSILEERDEYIQENGIITESKLDLTDIYRETEKMIKDDKIDSTTKIIRCFISKRRNNYDIVLSGIDTIKLPLTDILMGHCHSYYMPFKKMCFENIYVKMSMSIFFNIYILNCGYNDLTDLINSLIRDIYKCILFDNNEDEEVYNQIAKNIVKTMKDFMNIEQDENSKYNMYVNSFYIVNILEKFLRDIFIKSCVDRNTYIENCTLKDIFDESVNKNLRVMLGESLYRWLKYYLYHDKEEKNGFIIKEGMDIRNNIAHGNYRETENFSTIYYILIYLLMNVLWKLQIKMITRPTNETEKILKKIFKNSL